jgi:hypothetical protein
VVDALALILNKVNQAGHISGVVPHLIPRGIAHLQYADDTMILIQNNDLAIANLKFLLICFELVSGMKINYHKALFTSRVFEGIRGDYFVSRNLLDRLFTSLGFEGIIPGYPHKSPSL